MKKVLKVTGRIFLGILILIILFLAGLFIYNRVMLKKEDKLLESYPGELVEENGHDMCVYTSGEGEHTLLFLSGSGTAAPILDFKSLYSLMEDECKIVVVEKYGYGFSDVVDTERSFDTILRQDREALEKAGIEGPYILCPHSMSGLEAIIWAQEHPEEVEGIVGLDMAVPRCYDGFDFDGTMNYEKLAAAARELGVIRFFYTDSALPEKLTKDEKNIYKAIAAKKAVNCDVMNEGLAIPDACSEIDSKPKPDVPMLMFISDGKETGVADWIDIQKEYASDLTSVKTMELGCGHYVHNEEYELISREIREFIKTL